MKNSIEFTHPRKCTANFLNVHIHLGIGIAFWDRGDASSTFSLGVNRPLQFLDYSVSEFQERVNKTDDRGYTALHWATSEEAQRSDQNGSALDVVRLLHKAGADINHKDNKRRTGE